jgi:sigma-E factor negative regulatory protein RseA
MVMGEEISRFMDGEVDGAEADAVYRQLKHSEGTATWVCYHVIGDALRGSAQHLPGFAERFAQRMASEPTVLAPRSRANAGLPFAWAAAATLAAVVVVGWVAVTLFDSQPTALATAREAGTVRATVGRAQPVAPDYLIAHQEYSPTTQIQGVGPYLRSASAGGVDAGK